tara:strand:+ start:4000 stop:7905 length:3906 start_codon:yes stop_codon:yes gene_type:complete
MSESNSSEFDPGPEPQIELDLPDSESSGNIQLSPIYADYQRGSDPKSEEDISELNKVYQPWTIIDTYFRDTNYYKTQHQIDSFNEFITSDENGIRKIIKRNNPLRIFKGETSEGNYSYEMEIFFGETIDGVNKEIIDGTDNIFITSPSIYNEETDTSTYMYPNEARLKSLTYKTCVYCNIGIKYIFHGLSDTDPKKVVIKNFEKVNIGCIPIMLHSKLCILNKLDPIKLSKLGECPYDQGGYFVIKGKEKVFLSQESTVNNILYINKVSGDNIILKGTIKTVSNEGFQSSRTNYVTLRSVNLFLTQGLKKFLMEGYDINERKENILDTRILGINESNGGKDLNIPVFILFRALGFNTDNDILKLIIYDSDDTLLKEKLLKLIMPSIKHSQPIYNQRDAIHFLSLHVKNKEIINVIDALNNNFLPNYGNNYKFKGIYLGYMCRQVLLTHLGILKEADRDSYTMKRINLAGSLLLELYRELWGKFTKGIQRTLDDEFKILLEGEGKIDVSEVINEINKDSVFNCKIMDDIVRSFGASFGTGISKKQGIVQDLNRNVMLGTLSHVRRLSTPLPSSSKTFGPRKLHNSQWGIVCPIESPDGGNVGIINHLAIIAKITTNISETGILEALKDMNILFLESLTPYDFYNTKIFLNGKFIGVYTNGPFLYKYLKLLKLNSIINVNTSISFNIDTNEIFIFTDSGRIIRPVLFLKTNSDIEKYNEFIEGDYNLLENWNKCIHGLVYNYNPNVSVYDNTYYRDILNEIKDKEDNYMEFLEKNASPIEYLDSMETENSFIAKDVNSIDKDYTHCEIHPSLIMSAVALNIPFSNNSQYPRNVFSCQQTKQAVGVYSSAYNSKFETFAHILYYPQKPIVTTRYKKYTDVDKLPYGINAIVAIACYSGYNQEDAVILNETSVQRGLYNSLYLRSYGESEEDENGKKVYFSNPLLEPNTMIKNPQKYDNLDDNGFIKEETYITPNDTIVGKCYKSKDKDGKEITNCFGATIKFGTSGIVDRVVVNKNKEGLRTCKVRVRKIKIPGIGDKFTSRCGQKGMCGMIIKQEDMPFTKEGLVPDIIINPHAIPSRMTINQFLEVILGKSCCISGHLGDATPFQDGNVKEYGKVLGQFGYNKNGEEVMYSGINGEQIKTSIFIGPTYYQRLKIMVADKVHSRATGRLQHLVRQPVGGKSNNGGGRIGEMERDSIISHGIASFLKESNMERSDKFNVQVDKTSGLIQYDKDTNNKETVQIPYAMKLLIQELQTMGLSARIMTESLITNKNVFNNLTNDYYSGNNIDDIYDENDFEEEEVEEE